jgi:hypothetical protein
VGAGGALALLHYGLERIDLVLLVVGIVALALVSVALLLTIVGSLVLFLRLRKKTSDTAIKLECGFPKRTGFVVGSPWFVPFVRIGWTWVSPEVEVRLHRRGLQIHEEVIATRRALRDDVRRRFEVGDSFGFTSIAFELTEPRPVRFVPTIGALKRIEVLRSLAAGEDMSHPEGPLGGERMDMRHYVPGDPIRFILWKVFARSREVVIRTPERAIGPAHQTVAYVVTSKDDEPAAGAAKVAVEGGALGADWVLGADGCDTYASSSVEALEVLSRSGETPEEQGGAGLGDFLREATPGGLGRALVFVPGKPGPWIDRVLRSVAQSRSVGIELVVCTDGIDRTKESQSKVRRWLRRPMETFDPRKGVGPCRADEVAEVCRRLAATRARVVVLDRMGGRVYSEAHQRSLEAA